MKASKQFLKKHSIPESHQDFIELQDLLSNNTGYMLMFTKFRFEQQIDLNLLRGLYTTLINNKNLLSDLPNPPANYSRYSDLMFDLSKVKAKSSIKQFIQVCPSALKTILRDNERYWNEIQASCIEFNKLTPVKRKAFTITISRHKNFRAVKDALNSFIQYVNNGTDIFTMIDKTKKMPNCHIRKIDLENNFLLIRATTKKVIVDLGKGSAWCIADRHLQNFETYVPNNECMQYILFDFNYAHNSNNHRIALTNRGNRITNIHDNRNGAMNFNDHILSNNYLNGIFKGYDNEANAENIIDSIGKGQASPYQISELIGLGFADKLKDQKLNASQALKVYVPLIMDAPAESARRIVTMLLPMVESTKFFNTCIPALYKLDVETINTLIEKGLFLKYGVHLDDIINTYFKGASGTTTREIVDIDGVQFEKVVILTPLNSMNLDILDLILSTNSDVVTNKSLNMANDFDNLELFRVLLKHYKTKKNNKVRKAYELKPAFLQEVENEGLL